MVAYVVYNLPLSRVSDFPKTSYKLTDENLALSSKKQTLLLMPLFMCAIAKLGY